jgi:predicted ATPase
VAPLLERSAGRAAWQQGTISDYTAFAHQLGRMDLRSRPMHLINPNLFVVSGGPGAGKTTVLEELASRGYPFAPEVARQIIQEQLQSSGTALPWGDREAYTLLMLKRSVESYLAHTPASRPTFSDRGIPDTLCYARLIGLANQNSILDACQRFRYAPVVFLAPPWKEIYETDSERKQDFAEAETTFEQMVQVYTECGYTISELPKARPPARADFVLEQIDLAI